MAATNIQWTDYVWNPVVGCSVISPGCTNCYAMKLAGRLEAMGSPIYAGHTTKTKAGFVWNGHVAESNWGQMIKPLSWKRPRRIFVNSMSDLFHKDMPEETIDRVFAIMALCPQHTFQVLTKRPERMRDYLASGWTLLARWAQAFERGTIRFTQHEVDARLLPSASPEHRSLYHAATPAFPLPNVWLGVSVEDPERKSRIDILRETAAPRRFLSLEPLLADLGEIDLTGIDWVIVGGESGKGWRPIDAAWVRSIRDQCQAAGVAFFLKQWAGQNPKKLGRELDGREWNEMPGQAKEAA